MKLRCFASCALLLFCLSSVLAQDPANDAAKKLKENPNDVQLIVQFMKSGLAEAQRASVGDPDAAAKKVDEMAKVLGEVTPDDAKAKELLENAQHYLVSMKERLILAKTPLEEITKKLEASPANQEVLSQYANKIMQTASELAGTDLAKAAASIEEAKSYLTTIRDKVKDNEDASKMMDQVEQKWNGLAQQIQGKMERENLRKTPLEEIVKKLEANPANQEVISQYATKIMQTASELARTDLVKAAASVEEAKSFLTTIRDKVKDNEDASKMVDQVEQSWDRLAQQIQAEIEREKKLAALIGQNAAPLTADAWVNGQPVTDEDLKGKVVLLDFWAVWCGPCISTFPHLQEWYEQYKDKGLVMIGATRYCNFVWNDEKNEMERSNEEVTPENEQAMHEKEHAMLVKFAEQHQLHHVFAVQKDTEFSDYYAVSGIPEVVLIDRAGKVRLVKVGSGPDNTKEIGDMLKQLIEEK